MGKVDVAGHGGGDQRPALTPEVLDGADAAVLTIKEARTGIPTAEGRKVALLVFDDAPTDDDGREYVLWLNKSDLTVLVERLGDDDAKWPGVRVPIHKVRATNPKTGKPVTKYHIVPDEEWDDAMAEVSKRRGGGKRGKKAAKARR